MNSYRATPTAFLSVAGFLLALAVVLVFVLATLPSLPPVVASHFGADNLANGQMTRDDYRNFMLLFTLGIPLLACLPLAWLPARFPRLVNIPDRDYWLGPEQRASSLLFFRRHALRLATLVVLFMGAVHGLILQANALQPAQLPLLPFLVMLLLFLGGVLWWSLALVRRFPRRPA